jgi:hypothetical protein
MGARAEKLWADLKVDALSGPARALAEEACLVLGRLENLDRTLRGDEDAWYEIVTRLPPTVAEVVVNAPLAEARQQGLALRALLAELAKVTGVEKPAAAPASTVDEIARRRAERRGQAG